MRDHSSITGASSRLAALCSFACMAVLSAAAARAETCRYFDAGANESVDDSCSVAHDGYTETVTIGTKRVVFVQTARQGQWAVGTLDGKPAMRYETNRVTYSYATRDLQQFLDLTGE